MALKRLMILNRYLKYKCRFFVAAQFCMLSSGYVQADSIKELKALSLEQLANMEVSIASKTPQSVAKIPAAVFVITSEDIRRSSATNIPELLRMVPGINVAQIDGSHWAVSSRGFNGRFANKLLFLMDGRAVYSPLFSGVYWNAQDTLLEDVERIEVIRGPGASVWGSNAVNGVINIITRSAEDSHGNLLSISAGDPKTARIGLRHGGAINNDIDYRVYAKFSKNDELSNTKTNRANDDWDSHRIGFRMDGLLTADDDFTLQGDVYKNSASETSLFPDLQQGQIAQDQTLDDRGGNILARWKHSLDNSDQTVFQVYYDYQKRDEADDKQHTIDLDFQYHFAPLGQHKITIGVGYRRYKDHIKGRSEYFSYIPEDETQENYNAFIQDEIQLNKHWIFTIGSKFEDNEYTDNEAQPSARLLWQPQENNSIWLAVSKAVRTPSRTETAILGNQEFIPAVPPFQPPVLITGVGNPDQKSESLIAYELGYRFYAAEQFSFDITAFYNDYSDLRTIEPRELNFSNLPSYVQNVFYFDNKAEGKTWGTEIAVDWRFAEKWRLQMAYSYLEMDLELDNDSADISILATEESSPKQQLSLRLNYDPAEDWETDLWLRYNDSVVQGEYISDYWAFDARLAWLVNKQLTLSLVGQNIFDESHQEFNDELRMIKSTEIPRGVYVKAVWEF